MLKTRNIFIDTEVFVSNNFFDNRNLKRLAEFGNSETVNLYLTEITKNEIQSNIKEHLMTAQIEINNFKKLFSNKAKILQNLKNFKPYIDLPKFEVNFSFDSISAELDEFIKNGKVKFIPYELADLKSVINNYFNQTPPFSIGKKKYEFPDAIVLSAIENWCKKNDQRIYAISNDPDFNGYISNEIIIVPNIKIMLDKINKQHTIENDWILKIYELNKKIVIEKISSAFIKKLKDEIGFEIQISDINIEDIILYDESLVQGNIHSGEYVFELDYDVTFIAKYIYDEYKYSSYDYDKEDRYYFRDRIERYLEISTTQTAEILIEAYFEDGETAEDADVAISCTYTSIPDEENIEEKLEQDFYF